MSKSNNKQVKFATRIDGTAVIERHTPGGRLNHWIVGMAFILATLTGLALFHPALSWMAQIFGSPTWNRILHPFIGVVMAISFVGLMVRYMSHNFFNKDDIQWLKQINDVIAANTDKLPPIGMYNAGQKILFWCLTLLMLGLTVSGILIWYNVYFDFLKEVKAIAALSHAFFAFGMICFIIVHVLASFLAKGSLGAMVHGNVTYAWAKHNHSLWYKEIVELEEAMAKK